MSIISRQELVDNKWYTWVPYDNHSCLYFETNHQMTEEEAQARLDEALNPSEVEDGVSN